MTGQPEAVNVYTIGHSNHPLEEFMAVLRYHNIEEVADIRTIPHSAHNPQFNKEHLSRVLILNGINYMHMRGLGGLRHARADSPNTGWQNPSFRGFADYMQTPEFEAGFTELLEHAAARSVAMMCAEALPWRCHRSLIADALTARGHGVKHITGRGPARQHELTPFARIVAGFLVYPPAEEALFPPA